MRHEEPVERIACRAQPERLVRTTRRPADSSGSIARPGAIRHGCAAQTDPAGFQKNRSSSRLAGDDDSRLVRRVRERIRGRPCSSQMSALVSRRITSVDADGRNRTPLPRPGPLPLAVSDGRVECLNHGTPSASAPRRGLGVQHVAARPAARSRRGRPFGFIQQIGHGSSPERPSNASSMAVYIR